MKHRREKKMRRSLLRVSISTNLHLYIDVSFVLFLTTVMFVDHGYAFSGESG